MKICIILNGEIKDYDYINSIIVTGGYDYIICSDGGANHAYNMNIVPDYISLGTIKVKMLNLKSFQLKKMKQIQSYA